MSDPFLDVDFRKDPRYVPGDLTPDECRAFTVGPRLFAASKPSYEDRFATIPESEWKKYTDQIDAAGGGSDQLVTRIFNQKQEGSCHSEDTEVLTEGGWVQWSEYNWTDRLGTMNPVSGLLEFQSPLQRHVYDYDGEMIYSANRSIDFAVTENHRMFVRRWNQRQRSLSATYDFVEAGNLGWYVGLPHATRGYLGTELVKVAIDGDREYNGDDFAAFLAVVVSDGWAGNSENTRNRVSFCCFNESRQPMIRDLANRIGFREQPGRQGVWYRQDAPALAEWMRANIYGPGELGATGKRVPTIVKAASQRQIELFLRFFGDQSHTREFGAQYYTSSELLADDLQELGLRIGKRASINRREPRTSYINGRAVTDRGSFVVTEWGGDTLSLDRKKHVERERYRGPVYCATVPNGTLVTRRNKSVLVSGNCVGNAETQGHQVLQALQFGRDKVTQLSAISAYKQIGSSPSSGAMVDDSLEAGTKTGILPLDTPENRARFGEAVMPHTGFHTPFPSNWKETAKLFRFDETLVVRTAEGLVTAILNGHPVVVGRQGHSILYLRLMWKNGKWVMKYANSWSEDWGDAGFGYDTMNQIRMSSGWAYAIRSIVVPESK